MADLRAKVEGLEPDHTGDERPSPSNWYFDGFEEAIDKAAALIPPGAVLVTAATIQGIKDMPRPLPVGHLEHTDPYEIWLHAVDRTKAAILRRITEAR